MNTSKLKAMNFSSLHRMFFGFLVVFVLFPQILHACPALQDGIDAFAAGDHEKASRSFQLALDQHGPSAQLYFNRGLAAWHANETPQAVISFLRSLALDPGNKEAGGALAEVAAEHNLILPKSSPAIDLVRQFGIGPLWIIGSIISWAAVLLFLVGVFRPIRRGWLVFGGVLLLTVGSALLAGAYLADPLVAERGLAVVNSAKAVPARNNPVETAGAVENLPPGSIVDILSVRGSWTYCVLPSGKKAWLNSDSLLAVIPDQSNS
jgi:tetratricopeptide (TPR) repeat protein